MDLLISCTCSRMHKLNAIAFIEFSIANQLTGNTCFNTHKIIRKSDLHVPTPKLSLEKRTYTLYGPLYILFNSLPAHFRHDISLSYLKRHFIEM